LTSLSLSSLNIEGLKWKNKIKLWTET
jgi:hypothetical protein